MPKGDKVQQGALQRLVPEENRRFAAGVLASRCSGFTLEEIQRFPEHAQLAILFEVALERTAQDAKWGQQDHPLVDPLIAERPALQAVQRMAEEYEIPTAPRAKFLTDVAARRGNVTFGHIATEEQSEFVEAATVGDLWAARQEAIQAAAVWVAVVERIDRMAAERLKNWQADPKVQAVAERWRVPPEPRLVVLVARRPMALEWVKTHPEDAGKEVVITGPEDFDRLRGRSGPAVIRWLQQGLLGAAAPELEEIVRVINHSYAAGPLTHRDAVREQGELMLPTGMDGPIPRPETG